MTLRTGYGRGSPQWAAAAGDDTKGVDATVSGGLAPHFRLLELGGGKSRQHPERTGGCFANTSDCFLPSSASPCTSAHDSLRRGAPLLRCEWPARPRCGGRPYIFGASAASLLNSSGV